MLHGWTEAVPYQGRTDVVGDRKGVVADLNQWFSGSVFHRESGTLLEFLKLSGLPYSREQQIRRASHKVGTDLDAVLRVLTSNEDLGGLVRFLGGEEHTLSPDRSRGVD